MAFAGYAPGRVNLIGEHIDYNGGMVLPAALSIGLEVELAPRTDGVVTVAADSYDEVARRSIDDGASGHWSDPAVGAVREARALGLVDGGASLTIRSTIPQGSGLSSSAALIVAILKAARDAGQGTQGDVELAVAARRVENDYMGVPCGIMDQMAVAVATPGTAIALDTESLDYEIAALPQSHDFVVLHSGVTRKLADGRYKERKLECDRAKAFFGTANLCSLEPEDIAGSALEEPYRSRALHCATEHRRVLAALEAIKSGDIGTLAGAMAQSHASMRDDFAVSLPPIDALVADAMAMGADGARLTGGGFGGCIVALVENGAREDWLGRVLAAHPDARFVASV